MRQSVTVLTALLLIWMAAGAAVSAQTAGDYRSATDGNWNDASTWQTFDGSAWVDASSAPDGSEHITVAGEDTVVVDVAVQVSGYVLVEEAGHLTVGDGSVTFADGSTYEHARDAGSVPVGEWQTGSTFLLTGTVQDAPGNRNQDFHHVTFNTPELGRNRDMGWNDVTIGGDVLVLSTGANRWQMSSVAAQDTASFTIMGDVVVEDGQFAVQGTGTAMTHFQVHHYGDVLVTGGNFSLARGSQGSGTGTTTWYLYEGDFSLANATTQNSNPEPGHANLVFAADSTQQLSFDNVTYAGGQFNFEVEETATVEVSDGFLANGLVVNRGAITPLGDLTFDSGSVYDHARDGGDVPSATWNEGSTALFSGITGSAPGNRGQDYHDLVLNTPDLTSNRDLSLDGNTISGDIHVISTGSARWQLVGGSSGTVTIMGDVIVEDGQFASQGTSSETEVVIDHYGDVVVTGGNFAISRGSQGGETGTGSTRWYLHEGNLSISNATTQNSNPWRATFVFAGEGDQNLELTEVNYGGGGLPVTIADGATLHITGEPFGGNGAFVVESGGTLATAHPEGIDGVVQTTGDVNFDPLAGFAFTGTEAQVFGTMLPDSVGALWIGNAEGVTASDTVYSFALTVDAGALLAIDSTGSISVDGGTVEGSVVNEGELTVENVLEFGGEATYEHARDGGSMPSGVWAEGSTVLITGTVSNAPGNRNQDFHHVTFNTPDQLSNLNMSFDENTIGGDIRVIDTGSARWYLTSASTQDSAHVTLMGDVLVEGGQFSVQGTGNAETVFTVDHYGDIIVTGGNFSIARGSQGSGSGSTTWTLHEGDFRMSNAQTQNSNSDGATFVFAGEEHQLELGEENTIDNLPIVVSSGTTLDVGESEIGGSGRFTLEEDGTLAVAHADGVAGVVQTTGDVTLDEGASYVFNGTAEQVTSTLMPEVVNDLVINNEAGVTLSQETTINGVLRLQAGVFDNTIPFTLGEEASISEEGGSLLIGVSTEQLAEIPTEFQLHQNYPNPFNPSTTIRYDVRDAARVQIAVYDVTGRKVAELVNSQHAPGAYQIEWSPSGLASGVYLYRIDAGDFSAVRTLTLMK